ncbi:MAG: RNA polymerase sigma factor [bacterium]
MMKRSGKHTPETDFESLVRENCRKIYGLVYHMLGNTEDTEEALQEIFLRAYTALPRFRGEAALSTWLYRIAVSTAGDIIREKKRTRKAATEFQKHEAVPMPGKVINIEEAVMKKENEDEIKRAVLKLPPKYRSVFILSVIEGYSHKEITEILKISPGAVRVRLFRAVKLLREELSETLFKEGAENEKV